jgi:hypothetical protein
MSYDFTLYGSNSAREAIAIEKLFKKTIEEGLDEDPDRDMDPVVDVAIAGGALPLEIDKIEEAYHEYDYVGGVSEKDTKELLQFVEELQTEVLKWLQDNHPELL